MLDWITIPRFCALTGYSDDAVRAKKDNGVWREGILWTKAPDGRVLISQIGYDLWAEGRESEVLDLRRSRWISGGRGNAAGNASGLNRLPRI
jgi:hypothetical protein